jgi:hypothetical protein
MLLRPCNNFLLRGIVAGLSLVSSNITKKPQLGDDPQDNEIIFASE